MAEVPPPQVPGAGGVPPDISGAEVLAAAERVIAQSPDRPVDMGGAVPHPLEQAADAVHPAKVVGGMMEEAAGLVGDSARDMRDRLTEQRHTQAAERMRQARGGAGPAQFAAGGLTRRLRARGGFRGRAGAGTPGAGEAGQQPPAAPPAPPAEQ